MQPGSNPMQIIGFNQQALMIYLRGQRLTVSGSAGLPQWLPDNGARLLIERSPGINKPSPLQTDPTMEETWCLKN